MKVRLNEGRYHASACIINERYIYVFGGYKTRKLTGDYATTKINRQNEQMVNVTNGRIECYDTSKALEIKSKFKNGQVPMTSSGTDEEAVRDMIENLDMWPSFEIINIKRDPINNVGQLVVFPLINYWDINKKKSEDSKDQKTIGSELELEPEKELERLQLQS